MQANLLRMAALACSWLIAASLPSCAQSAGDGTDNAAAVSLQPAVAAAIAVSFSPSLELETDPQSQTKSPPSNPAAPSLQDLGISPTQVKENPREQRRLNKRSHMLKVHQTLGLITAIPMVAALITGPQAKDKRRNGQIIREPAEPPPPKATTSSMQSSLHRPSH